MSKYKIINYARNALFLLGAATVLLEPATILNDYAKITDLNGDGQKEFAIKMDDIYISWLNQGNGKSDFIPTIIKKSLDKKLE